MDNGRKGAGNFIDFLVVLIAILNQQHCWGYKSLLMAQNDIQCVQNSLFPILNDFSALGGFELMHILFFYKCLLRPPQSVIFASCTQIAQPSVLQEKPKGTFAAVKHLITSHNDRLFWNSGLKKIFCLLSRAWQTQSDKGSLSWNTIQVF